MRQMFTRVVPAVDADELPPGPGVSSSDEALKQEGARTVKHVTFADNFGKPPISRCLAMKRGAYEDWQVRTVMTPEGPREVFGPPDQ